MQKKRVLIADDEPSMRTTLADILADNGFDVSTAENGEAAIEMCEQEAYDVVLMDVRMPGIDGVEAFRRIRQTLEGVSVILMSAFGDEDLKHDALRDGAIAFLDKPLKLETVIQLIADSSGLSILAVTDDDALSALLPSLKSSRQKLTMVRSSSEAQQLLQQLNFDVALIDVELPMSTGLDCYLALRAIDATISAIMVSSSDRDLLTLAEEAVRRTAYTVITKPLQREVLSETIDKLSAQRLSGSIRKPDTDQS
jgi:DNA-binding NtrC family response regulator